MARFCALLLAVCQGTLTVHAGTLGVGEDLPLITLDFTEDASFNVSVDGAGAPFLSRSPIDPLFFAVENKTFSVLDTVGGLSFNGGITSSTGSDAIGSFLRHELSLTAGSTPITIAAQVYAEAGAVVFEQYKGLQSGFQVELLRGSGVHGLP